MKGEPQTPPIERAPSVQWHVGSTLLDLLLIQMHLISVLRKVYKLKNNINGPSGRAVLTVTQLIAVLQSCNNSAIYVKTFLLQDFPSSYIAEE